MIDKGSKSNDLQTKNDTFKVLSLNKFSGHRFLPFFGGILLRLGGGQGKNDKKLLEKCKTK